MINTSKQPVPIIKSVSQFSIALLKANLRNIKSMAITLGLPIFMLLSIWIPASTGDQESVDLMRIIFPAIILLSVIMPGLSQASRLTQWKEQKIITRLSLTPVPLSGLMLGTSLTQILIGIIQGVLLLSAGLIFVGYSLSITEFLTILFGMLMAGITFISFGTMIAAFCKRSDIASYIFFFTVMPLTFLASFPPEMMPDQINQITPWLPTSLIIEIIGPAFLNQPLSGSIWLSISGLIVYTLATLLVSVMKFEKQ